MPQTEEDERICSVMESFISHPLVSKSAMPNANAEEIETATSSATASEEPSPEATPDETPADADEPEEEKPAAAEEEEAEDEVSARELKHGSRKHGLPVQPRDANAVDR